MIENIILFCLAIFLIIATITLLIEFIKYLKNLF